MCGRATIGLAAAIFIGWTGASSAQGSAGSGSAMPNSNMAPPSGNTGDANNGVGQQGKLTGNAGSHSSTVTGPAAAAQIPTNPASPSRSGDAAKVESDPSQGGSVKR